MSFPKRRKNKDLPKADKIIYDRFHEKERVILFSDAVFAIVLLSLILELKPPSELKLLIENNRELWEAVSKNSNKIIAYLLSYLFIINLWFGHNQLFKLFNKVDNRMIWLNNLLLLNISFTPYPISLISEYPKLSGWYCFIRNYCYFKSVILCGNF